MHHATVSHLFSFVILSSISLNWDEIRCLNQECKNIDETEIVRPDLYEYYGYLLLWMWPKDLCEAYKWSRDLSPPARFVSSPILEM